jgi:hypothetical protein
MTEASLVAELVPFGKYKGKPSTILFKDQDYLHWVQDNLSDYILKRYPEFYPIIMNNGRRASDTRRHNRLQSLFLNDLYRRAFCRVAHPGWEEDVWRLFSAEVSHHTQTEHS